MNKPNIAKAMTSLKDMVAGMQYLMLASNQPEQIGTGFYAIYEPVTDEQYANILRGARAMTLEAYIVDCTFKEGTTVVLSNPYAPEHQRTITFEIDAQGNGVPITKRSLQ